MNNGDSRFPKALLFSFHCGTRYRLSRRHLRELLFGTGSMPPRPNGLQRSTLHTARASPRIAPHSFTASIAYCEQVGVNRQQGFLSGDMNFRYRVISHISTYFMTVYSRGRLGLRYEGFLTGLRPDPPKTFLKEGFWISKNFYQRNMTKVWIPFRISVLPKKATALCAAALSVVFPEKSEQTSDEKPELSERSDKVAFHLFRGRADSLSACGNHDKVSCSETALRQDAAISRPHYSLTAVSRYGVAELCRCREADAVEVLLLRVLFFQLRRLVVTRT